MSGTRRKRGQPRLYVESYRSWLGRMGYTPLTVRNMLKDLGQVGRWMSGKGLQRNDVRHCWASESTPIPCATVAPCRCCKPASTPQ
jgi:hypothetical protein